MDIRKRYNELSEVDRRKVDLLFDMLEQDERLGTLSDVWYDYDLKVYRSTYVKIHIEERSGFADIP